MAASFCSDREIEDYINKTYQGYYPAIQITATATAGNMLVVAGVASDGLPYVYRSAEGSIWEPVNLYWVTPYGESGRVQGVVEDILYDEESRYLYLLCNQGELVTVPDCPRCLKVCTVANQALIHGVMNKEYIYIQLQDGTWITVPKKRVAQYRITVSFAAKQLKKDGYLIHLQELDRDVNNSKAPVSSMEEHFKQALGDRYITMEPEQLSDWLDNIPYDMCIVYLCKYGTQADMAAKLSVRRGYTRAYSIGGSEPGTYIL